MSRQALKLVILAAILGISWFVGAPKNQPPPHGGAGPDEREPRPERERRQHRARRGGAWKRSAITSRGTGATSTPATPTTTPHKPPLSSSARKTTGLPAKRDADGSLRVFDPATGAFAAYNRDGTTKTYFKPGSPGYFERQPGTPVDLRTAR